MSNILYRSLLIPIIQALSGLKYMYDSTINDAIASHAYMYNIRLTDDEKSIVHNIIVEMAASLGFKYIPRDKSRRHPKLQLQTRTK